jgi:hypothetical protein
VLLNLKKKQVSEFKNLTDRQLFDINRLKSAVTGRYYYALDGRVFLGLPNHTIQERITSEEVIFEPGNENVGGVPIKEKTEVVTIIEKSSTRTKQVEVDFGETPHTNYKVFSVADPDLTDSSIVVANMAYVAPSGKSLDEMEMDSFSVLASASKGVIRLLVQSLTGSVRNKFKINYTISWQ